jgi:hypothetical protein
VSRTRSRWQAQCLLHSLCAGQQNAFFCQLQVCLVMVMLQLCDAGIIDAP